LESRFRCTTTRTGPHGFVQWEDHKHALRDARNLCVDLLRSRCATLETGSARGTCSANRAGRTGHEGPKPPPNPRPWARALIDSPSHGREATENRPHLEPSGNFGRGEPTISIRAASGSADPRAHGRATARAPAWHHLSFVAGCATRGGQRTHGRRRASRLRPLERRRASPRAAALALGRRRGAGARHARSVSATTRACTRRRTACRVRARADRARDRTHGGGRVRSRPG
jgi:hypothetical protein